MADQRIPTFPTRMNLKIIDNKEKSAEKGKVLLKRKSDSLKQKFKAIEKEYNEKKKDINKMLRDAFFKLSEAEFLGANVQMYIQECQKQHVNVKTEVEVISGITLTTFTLDKSNLTNIVWLDRSGQLLNECRNNFINVLELLVELSALTANFKLLEQVLLSTNRRVNALEYNVIPRLQNTINYINSELDEQDREDFFRLKKIQSLKNKK
ncbi:V-type proton ATPase subunit D (VMA6) [Vairimorpha necatrix]|uniref:V-type proton ATPase subunit D (VMA6) n=1 Tax=Vairimorpha necatrix TaxID=6039 RepID=A0AAX4JE06_9MICR